MSFSFKKPVSALLCLVLLTSVLSLFTLPAAADGYELPDSILEAGTWDELTECFTTASGAYCYNYDHVVIRLTADLSDDSAHHPGDALYMRYFQLQPAAKITIDFCGHTLRANDTASWANTDAYLQDFLVFNLSDGSELTFDDSVGGGGVYMYSRRAIDSAIAAVRIVSYDFHDEPYTRSKVIFNGGTYTLDAECIRFGYGTNEENNCWKCYRGTVIADYVNAEINGGRFEAISRGLVSGGTDWCARELTAFGTTIRDVVDATAPYNYAVEHGIEDPRVQCHTVINGGYFISDGYAIHNFENNYDNLFYNRPHRLDSYSYVNYPEIYGGRFEGGIDCTGLTFTYSEGNPELNVRPASQIVKGDLVAGVKKNGNSIDSVEGLTWRDLHGLRSLTVISSDTLGFSSGPELPENATYHYRNNLQSDVFYVDYVRPGWFDDAGIGTQPTIRYKINYLDEDYTDTYKRRYELSYSGKDGLVLTVRCELYLYVGMGGDVFTLFDSYTVRVVKGAEFFDNIRNCTVIPESGEMNVALGDYFVFTIVPNEGYEIVNPADFAVYADEERIYPNASGTYTVKAVQESIFLTSDGVEPKGIAGVSVVPGAGGGAEHTYDLHTGDTFTLGTPASYGFTAPAGADFRYWKVGGSSTQYQPGDSFEITKVGNIEVRPVYNKIYYITVIGGTAYADAEHTQPITCATYNANYDTFIYVVADPKEEGDTRVFSSWSIVEGRHGGWEWQGAGNTETYFYLSDSDVTVQPTYSYQIDGVTILDFPAPEIGKTFDKYTGVEKTPEGAGYSWAYWDYCKDITGEEPVTLTTGESVFEEGHTYEASFVVRNRSGNIFPEDLDIALTLGGVDPAAYTVTNIAFTNSYHEYVEFTVVFEPLVYATFTTVSGNITAFGDEDRPGSVTLTREGESVPSYMTAFYGNDTTYLLEDIANGVYTLTAAKNGCAAYTTVITVGAEPVVLDIVLQKATLFGDLNDDGIVSISDVTALLDYLAVSDGSDLFYDLNGDGAVSISDVSTLLNFLAEI